MIKKKFSIILPIYKNEANLPVTIPYIVNRLNLFPKYDVEIIMVCDGSPDNSYRIMQEYQQKYPKFIKIAKFNKNYGQRAAIDCGMMLASGDVIGIISADLQDPFELFVEMLESWENGESLVIAYRNERSEKGISAKCSNILHSFINRNINSNYPQGGFDFFVVDKTIAKAFVESDTKNNSMQLLLLSLAGHAKQIGYKRKQREIGKSGWNLNRKFNQALNIITIYSDKPFKVFGGIGVTGFGIGFLLLIIGIITAVAKQSISIYLFIYSAACLNIGAILLSVGVLGIYGFKWMENHNKIPKYQIEEMIDETK